MSSRRPPHSYALQHAAIVVQGQPLALPGRQISVSFVRPDAVGRVLLAIDRSDMRRISIEVWSSDSKLFFVRIDPFPHLLARGPARRPCFTLYAHNIGRQPVTVAAAQASSMK